MDEDFRAVAAEGRRALLAFICNVAPIHMTCCDRIPILLGTTDCLNNPTNRRHQFQSNLTTRLIRLRVPVHPLKIIGQSHSSMLGSVGNYYSYHLRDFLLLRPYVCLSGRHHSLRVHKPTYFPRRPVADNHSRRPCCSMNTDNQVVAATTSFEAEGRSSMHIFSRWSGGLCANTGTLL